MNKVMTLDERLKARAEEQQAELNRTLDRQQRLLHRTEGKRAAVGILSRVASHLGLNIDSIELSDARQPGKDETAGGQGGLVDAGAGYRLLEPKELVRIGYDFLAPDGRWEVIERLPSVKMLAGDCGFPVRRKVEQPSHSGDYCVATDDGCKQAEPTRPAFRVVGSPEGETVYVEKVCNQQPDRGSFSAEMAITLSTMTWTLQTTCSNALMKWAACSNSRLWCLMALFDLSSLRPRLTD